MSSHLGVGLLGQATGWALGYTVRSGAQRRHIVSRLVELTDLVRNGLNGQDHLVATLDRRLQDVEQSAARAEREVRLVSAQLADMNALPNGSRIDGLSDDERGTAGATLFDSEVRDGS